MRGGWGVRCASRWARSAESESTAHNIKRRGGWGGRTAQRRVRIRRAQHQADAVLHWQAGAPACYRAHFGIAALAASRVSSISPRVRGGVGGCTAQHRVRIRRAQHQTDAVLHWQAGTSARHRAHFGIAALAASRVSSISPRVRGGWGGCTARRARRDAQRRVRIRRAQRQADAVLHWQAGAPPYHHAHFGIAALAASRVSSI